MVLAFVVKTTKITIGVRADAGVVVGDGGIGGGIVGAKMGWSKLGKEREDNRQAVTESGGK